MDNRLWEDVAGVRRFKDETIQRAVDSALHGIEGKALVLDVDLDGNGVRGVAAFHTPGGWSIGVIGEIDAKKNWEAGVSVKKVWR
jgi:hypothetical protein